MKSESVLEALPVMASELGPILEWLTENHIEPRKLVERALAVLHRAGRQLQRKHVIAYCKKTIIDEFLRRWAMKHRGEPLSRLLKDPETKSRELRPFEIALALVGDERNFERTARRFIRADMARRLRVMPPSPEGFSSFVLEKALPIAERFLKNFDTTRKSSAFSYLERTAVSLYLTPRAKDGKPIEPNDLDTYIRTAKRLSPKTVLALKLAYVPALLTKSERDTLRRDFGFRGNVAMRLPIKTIAERLGYANAAALSRKLYRVRKWCEDSARRRSSGGVQHD